MSLSHQQIEGYVLYKELLGEGENGSTTLMRGARGKMGGGRGNSAVKHLKGCVLGEGAVRLSMVCLWRYHTGKMCRANP